MLMNVHLKCSQQQICWIWYYFGELAHAVYLWPARVQGQAAAQRHGQQKTQFRNTAVSHDQLKNVPKYLVATFNKTKNPCDTASILDLTCYEPNVCVAPKLMYWNLNLQKTVLGGVAFGRCSGHEGGALMNRIHALIKETPESSSALFLPREDTVRIQRGAGCQPLYRRLSPEHHHAGTLMSNSQTPVLWAIESVVYKLLSLQYFVIAV